MSGLNSSKTPVTPPPSASSSITPSSGSECHPNLSSTTFDLEGDPSDFQDHVKVYLCLLAGAIHPDPTEPLSYTTPHPPPVPASDLVNSERLSRGLELLRREKAERPTAEGRIFSSTLNLSPSRTLYKFIPKDMDEDELNRMLAPTVDDPNAFIDQHGTSLVLTDFVLPVPPLLMNARPESLYHTIISWLYGHFHPAEEAAGNPRVSYDSDDSEQPLQMDKCYPDTWIHNEIAAKILREIAGLRSSGRDYANFDPSSAPSPAAKAMRRLQDAFESRFPWGSTSAEVEFPVLGHGDE